MNNKILFIAVIAFILLLTGCDKESLQGTVTGSAVAKPSVVKNGEEVCFRVESEAIKTPAKLNGKEYYPIIRYCIDGVEVVQSQEKQVPFSANYKIENLSQGEHKLSAVIVPSRKNSEYANEIEPSFFTVIE